jgi:L-phenylalanine/L-methionine N-acetyltransferase
MPVTVRRATPNDAAAYARIMGDPAVFPGLMQLPFTNEELWRERLIESCSPGKPDLPLSAELDGEVVGNAGLHPAGMAVRRRHVMMIGMAVASGAQRRGVGSALMAAMCDYADHWAGVLRLELSVYTDNAGAIALYRKFGFAIEGTHRGYAMRGGQFADVHSMARLHPNPPRLGPA